MNKLSKVKNTTIELKRGFHWIVNVKRVGVGGGGASSLAVKLVAYLATGPAPGSPAYLPPEPRATTGQPLVLLHAQCHESLVLCLVNTGQSMDGSLTLNPWRWFLTLGFGAIMEFIGLWGIKLWEAGKSRSNSLQFGHSVGKRGRVVTLFFFKWFIPVLSHQSYYSDSS